MGRTPSKNCIGDVRIPLESAERKRTGGRFLEHGESLPRPLGVVQFVEGNDRSTWHAGQEVPQGDLGWLVEIAINEKQAY